MSFGKRKFAHFCIKLSLPIIADSQNFVTHLHKTSLKSKILHVQFKHPFCRAQSLLQFGENQKSILFFYPKLWNFENSKTSNLKVHTKEKMTVKEKNHVSTPFKQTFKIAKMLEKSSRIM